MGRVHNEHKKIIDSIIVLIMNGMNRARIQRVGKQVAMIAVDVFNAHLERIMEKRAAHIIANLKYQ